MSKGIGNKSTWVLIMLVLIGAVLGSFIGNLADGIETAQLSPVGIAANVYVHRAESLPWMPILLFGKKDEPRTSAKDGQTFENGLADRVEESQVVEQTELSGGFTTRNDEPVFRLFPI